MIKQLPVNIDQLLYGQNRVSRKMNVLWWSSAKVLKYKCYHPIIIIIMNISDIIPQGND